MTRQNLGWLTQAFREPLNLRLRDNENARVNDAWRNGPLHDDDFDPLVVVVEVPELSHLIAFSMEKYDIVLLSIVFETSRKTSRTFEPSTIGLGGEQLTIWFVVNPILGRRFFRRFPAEMFDLVFTYLPRLADRLARRLGLSLYLGRFELARRELRRRSRVRSVCKIRDEPIFGVLFDVVLGLVVIALSALEDQVEDEEGLHRSIL